MTYRKLLRNEVDKRLLRALEGNSAWGDPIHYLYRRVKIDDLVPYPDDGVAILKHLLRTSFERQFLEISLRNREINDEYVQRIFKHDAILDEKAALEQLEDFLSVNGSM